MQVPREPRPLPPARQGNSALEHLLRRAAFGASASDVEDFGDSGYSGALARLLSYESEPDNVDELIGKPGYVGVTARGEFQPTVNINDARQRWLFRMIHTRRPLQEKMALFWHNHFATAYTKVAGAFGAAEGARYMSAQVDLFRQHALGNFRDLLVAVAKDVAMLVWLDGRTNVKGRPQENFARELMELFTMGVGTFAEADVYAGARVFTGWNLTRSGTSGYQFAYVASQHDTAAKEFTFAIFPDGGRTIPARSAEAGAQDGVDLIGAVARHPATGPRLARKLYAYFVSETGAPDEALIADLARTYYASNFEMNPVLYRLFTSPQFLQASNRYARYSWPAEFVARAIKEVGWAGLSVNDALTPMANMGQQLFEPPDVAGWELGPAWFSSGAMLARMNFAAQLAGNQKFNLRDLARGHAPNPRALLSLVLDRLSAPPLADDAYGALVDYAGAGGAWTGSDAQLATKVAGLVHLVVASGDYQLV